MSDVKWIKLSTELFDNRKIKHLRKLPEGNNILLIWIFLLTLAGRCNAGGMIFLTENIPYTAEMLADESGFDVNTVKLAIDALVHFGMISTDPLLIEDWNSHQNIDGMEKIRDQERLRKQKQRDNHKLLKMSRDSHGTVAGQSRDSHGTVTGQSRDSHGTVTQCHATEKEEEREEEKEKEYSIFLSSENEKREAFGGALGQGVVMLSQEQTDDLLEKLSIDEFDHYVSVIAECEKKGKHFGKTHYQAILDMAAKDRRKQG